MGQRDRFSSYSFGEGKTGTGQLVNFSCPSDVTRDQVREFLETNIRSIDVPTTGRINVPHGGYGMYTRYDVVQHNYAGGGPGECGGWGYIEVLEIKNPPDDRWGIVINECTSPKGSVFTEWDSVENAQAAFAKNWGELDTSNKFRELAGYKRRVECGALTPWFYAIGNEQLIDDYAFPEGLQDDAIYRFGKQFVAFDYEDIPAVKTCMGTRFYTRKSDYHPYKEYRYRLVCWNDGTVWDEGSSHSKTPRPVEEGEMWIAEAVQQFRRLLAGKGTEFVINFTDDTKFVGKIVQTKHHVLCAEGDYLLTVSLKGKKKSIKGWVNDFKPSPEFPDIVQYIIQDYAHNGLEVEHIEIKQSKTKTGGKKWSGVFFHPPRQRE